MPKLKVLVVGQTPPPFGGQAIMIDNLVKTDFENLELYHVRMDFSSDLSEIGKFKFKKISTLISLVIRIFFFKIKYNINVLYYPPAGSNIFPILRDVVVLFLTKFLFTHVVYHFHAGGLSEKIKSIKIKFLRKIIWRVYAYPTLSIRISSFNPDDGNFLGSKFDYVLPYGIKDFYKTLNYKNKTENLDVPIEILFVGLIKESKGVFDLLEAAKILKLKGHSFKLNIMGRFESLSTQKRLESLIEKGGLKNKVDFLGVLTGVNKFDAFHKADIFCFPSFFECETFGIVLLEAMQFGCPIVSTYWRGIPSVVQNDYNAFLVPIKSPKQIAEKLQTLIENPITRLEFGKNGRQRFEDHFTEDIFYRRFESILIEKCSD